MAKQSHGTISRHRKARANAIGMLMASVAMAAVAMPSSAMADGVQINVIDVSGNLALTQQVFDNYLAANPEKVSRFTFTKAPAPELAGKIQAMQNANRMDIDIVLTGADGLAAGMQLGLWEDLTPYIDQIGDPNEVLNPGAVTLQALADMQGVVIAYSQQGPFIEYMPDRVSDVPGTAEELLAWCKANPNKLIYARPANSGAGRTFLMGLPFILGDSDPKDPINGWDKTWAYLAELNTCIEYYPSGTSTTFKELGNGTRDIAITSMGWDINPRYLGTVPASAEVAILDNTTFIGDGHLFSIPKGLSEERRAVAIDVLKFMLQPEQQAITYDAGYLYPGPSVKGVTIDMAPEESQQVMAEFGRPMYDELIETTPIDVILEPDLMIEAFRKWDEEIGAGKGD
ncbi:extracellular solute-binding protein [Devosia ginsengisoli]|uniref:extracellular solute-binding protein n=1 Tax=Devosia ginsengisoli TaxID=400770 RepID=UPI0026F2DFD0|nr:extracellular solute-binding protein [Devosia ginsengisoli]MCR6671328.1 extracellular solute-binding protein [Devosia ginsengisoli]